MARMDLKTYWTSLDAEKREQFVSRCSPTSKGHIQNVMYGVRPCSADLAVLMERHSDGKVTVEESGCDCKWVRLPDPSWPHPKGRPLQDHQPVTPTPYKGGPRSATNHPGERASDKAGAQ
jgi:hypothetical protein